MRISCSVYMKFWSWIQNCQKKRSAAFSLFRDRTNERIDNGDQVVSMLFGTFLVERREHFQFHGISLDAFAEQNIIRTEVQKFGEFGKCLNRNAFYTEFNIGTELCGYVKFFCKLFSGIS